LARSPNPKEEKAKKLYKTGMKLVEIASQLNIPEGTVRRWKSTYGWDSERSDKNSERSEKKKNVKKKAVADEVKEVISNTELTDKQQLFCIYYIRCFNATKAYQKAYGCSYQVANAEGYKLLVNPCVKAEIMKLKQEKLNREFLSESDIFQKYMDIAFSDITDYVNIENGFCVSLRREIDGSIVDSISNSESGVKIKLADRMKALQWLTDHMNMATEEQRLNLAKLNYEVTQLSGQNNDNDSIANFLSAVKPSKEDLVQLFADEGEEDAENIEKE